MFFRRFALAAIFVTPVLSAVLFAQDQQQNTQLITDDQILHHLNAVITWYRNIKTQIEPSGLPTDAVYQANAESLAAQVVKYAFESAEKAAPFIPNNDEGASSSTANHDLAKFLADTQTHNAALQTQISQLNHEIASAPKRDVLALTNQRDRVQGELDLGQSMVNSLTQLTQTSNQAASNQNPSKKKTNQPTTQNGQPAANSFAASVTQLRGSVPEVFDPKMKASAQISTPQQPSASNGLLGKLRRLYDQSLTLHQIDTLMLETSQLQDLVYKMREPLRNALRQTTQQGRALSSVADNPQPGQTAPTKQDFDNLAAKFDQIAAVEVPLSQQASALAESQANLKDWRDSIASQYGSVLRSILYMVAVILGVLGVLMLVSNFWKKMIFRYITDIRRRRQFLLVRRFVIGFMIGLILMFSVINEFSSLATFAGFITAGIAVGLQTILLSVAAYFFLIGRYGIRVGDRISIAGVTGDVIDVSFVRFYLLELAGAGADLQPTGRIVAFANSVLFQATSPMFRQVPGTAYTWHEVAVSLEPTGDYELVEKNMLEVVNKTYEKYQQVLDRQHGSIEKRFELPFTPLKPVAQLQLSSTGLEAIVRYPVSLRHGAETDDEITRNLIDAIGKTEGLKTSVTGLPRIRSVIRP
jgi:small-conductance mechanosensitive channel